MGKFINEDDILHNIIEDYSKKAVSDYSIFIEGTPTFVTYYHQNMIFTTSDKGLENIEDDLGRNSPVKYDKINNFPIYINSTLSTSVSRTDMGIDTSAEGEAVILPEIIKPYPNDYFVFEQLGENFFFKVTNVVPDSIKSKPFYKIDYIFSKDVGLDSSSHIETQINDDYTVIFNNIGTDINPLIKTSSFLEIKYSEDLYEKLFKFYTKAFFNLRTNAILFNFGWEDIIFYNRFLNKFIMDNNIFERKREFMDTIRLEEYIEPDVIFDNIYEGTIYYAIEKKTTKYLKYNNFSYLSITSPHTPFFNQSMTNVKDIIINDTGDNIYLTKDFYGRIITNLKYTDEVEFGLENFIIDYLNGEKDVLTKKELDIINESKWLKDLRSYILIPILLFIIKNTMFYYNKKLI